MKYRKELPEQRIKQRPDYIPPEERERQLLQYLEWLRRLEESGVVNPDQVLISPYQLGIDPNHPLLKKEGEEEVDEKQENELENRFAVALLYETPDSGIKMKHIMLDAVSNTDALGQAVQTYSTLGNLITFNVLQCSVTGSPLEMEIFEMVKDGKKIQAIKRYREETSTGLKDARDWVFDRITDWKDQGLLPSDY